MNRQTLIDKTNKNNRLYLEKIDGLKLSRK
jgi:hypothetical protein